MNQRRVVSAVTILLISVLAATASVRAVGVPSSLNPQASDELPDGDGKKILQVSCTACHDLTEVTKFKGYYTRDDWRDVVKTMVEYGAQVKAADVDVLVEYLAKNLGKK